MSLPASSAAGPLLYPLDVASAIRSRRAVRHYRPELVPEELLDELTVLAIEAPSSWNLQDRHLVVVRSREGLAALTEATGCQPQPQEAPVVVVFLADLAAHTRDRDHIWRSARDSGAWSEAFIADFAPASQAFQEELASRGALREYAVKDAMIAASFFILAAASRGLATSPMNGWDENKVKRAVGVEDRDELAVALLIALGYAAENPRHPGRQPRSWNVFEERFGRSFRAGRQ